MTVDRLDAVVIGANVEGLAAAVTLARAGHGVVVVERKLSPALLGLGRPAFVSSDTVRALDLVARGARFAPPPPLVGLNGETQVVLWPEEHALRAGIAALSPRDAEAFGEFRARIVRAARTPGATASPVAWLTGTGAAEEGASPPFWLSSIVHALDEAFDSDMVKGIWAQGAVIGTGVSPAAPMSASLFARASLLATVAPDVAARPVSGGRARLIAALIDELQALGGEVRFGAEAQEIIIDRDAAQGVQLVGGIMLRAPTVISSLDPRRSYLMLVGLRRLPMPVVRQMMGSRSEAKPGLVRLVLGASPPFRNVDPAVLAAAPVIRVNAGLDRLMHAHGAFRRRQIGDDISLDAAVRPLAEPGEEPGVRWEVTASVPYIPAETTEGPWSAGRRERLRELVMAALEAVAPGIADLAEEIEVLNPPEPQTNMGPNGAAFLQANASGDPTALPRPLASPTSEVLKNLIVLERSVFASDGEIGIQAARALGAPKAKGRLRA